jgi:DNA-directed RNA polymerase subunit RPC12/RpoP
MGRTKEYICSLCGGSFCYILDGTWSEEDAKKEYEHLFPNSKWEDRKIVCDVCWGILDITQPQYRPN